MRLRRSSRHEEAGVKCTILRNQDTGRHGRACPGHPRGSAHRTSASGQHRTRKFLTTSSCTSRADVRLPCGGATWMAGTSPAMYDKSSPPSRSTRPNICFLKIASHDTVLFAMTSLINSPARGQGGSLRPPHLPQRSWSSRPSGRKEKMPRGGSAQAFEKARIRHGNPRKSKPFPLIFLARARQDFARFD